MRISPFIISGSVSCDFKDNIKFIDLTLFYLSGGISNIIMFIIFLFVGKYTFAIINAFLAMFTLMPITILNNDMVQLLVEYRLFEKEKYEDN